MPRISEFYGISIAMFHNEHGAPHFHANYAEHNASVGIESGAILTGDLPARALRLVAEWRTLHEDELMENWRRARRGQALDRVPPLP